jgi:hypothetical protein
MDGLIDDLERNPEFQVVQSFIPEAVLTSTLQLRSSRIGNCASSVILGFLGVL